MVTFFERFSASTLPGPVFSLQLVYPEVWTFDAAAVDLAVRTYHPEFAEAILEWQSAEGMPELRVAVSSDGPPMVALGLLSWGGHIIRIVAFDSPMPYGPIASCVVPALMPTDVKQDAAAHRSHLLLYHGGPETDPHERMTGLTLAGAALSTLGATAILNEEARTAIPAFDLWPEADEDIVDTICGLPFLYLFAGFVRTSVGAPERPWIRTFGCGRFGLPDLAMQAKGLGEASAVFTWFNAILNYVRTTDSGFHPGQRVALSDELQFELRAPQPAEADFLDTDGTMIVLERAT